jgi:transposase
MRKVKQYEEEFKKQTVDHIEKQRKPVAQAARELGIAESTLHGWMSKYGRKIEELSVDTLDDPRILREYQKRIRDLEETNAILKKAMHIFTSGRN